MNRVSVGALGRGGTCEDPCGGRRELLEALYVRHGHELRAIVGRNLTLAGEMLDDACQCAWGSLLFTARWPQPGRELAWLTTTATREALRMLRRSRMESALFELEGLGGSAQAGAGGHRYARDRARPRLALVPTSAATSAADPCAAAESRERLADLRRLPRRQQQLLWLQGIGYGYDEISAATGASARTVERQLHKARQRLRG